MNNPTDGLRVDQLGETPVVASETLLKDRKELVIVHDKQLYRLRETRNGKLILTK